MLFTSHLLATGAPTLTPLTYAGTVTDAAGKPYPTAVDVQLAFYDSLNATTPKCTAPLTKAEAGTGRFQVVLPPDCVQAVHDVADLWTEAVVGPGQQVLPRTHVGAVPYALEADSAKQAATAQAATGGLKAEIDGVKADVAALKQGGGAAGGGGPWVVDATGAKLGKLIAASKHWANGGGATYVQWGGIDVLEFLTSAGYHVEATPKGYLSVYNDTTQVVFSEKGCTGTAGISTWLSTVSVTNRRAVYLHGQFFVLDGPLTGATSAKQQIYFQSALQPGALCSDNKPAYAQVVPVKKASPADLGLPPNVVLPLTMSP